MSRRGDARSVGRGILPPRKPPHKTPAGQASPTTDPIPRSEKSSRRSRPLSSSTNNGVPETPDVSTQVSKNGVARLSSAPSQWKMGRSPTPGPPDENDDWLLNQQAPPLPELTEKSRSRTRTSSAGGSKNNDKFQEKKSRSLYTRDDTAVQTGQEIQVAFRNRRNTDADDNRLRSHPSPVLQDKNSSLKRRISWRRGKKDTQEAPSDESNSKRANELGLPELERELVPSLRDTVYRMTGELRPLSNDPQYLSHGDTAANSYARSIQNYSASLSPPPTYERAKSPLSLRSTSPLPKEPVKSRQRTHSFRTLTHDENGVVDHEPPIRERSVKATNSKDDHDVSAKVTQGHEVSEGIPSRKSCLKTPRSANRVPSLSPNMDTDNSASEPGLRTPRVRSSSRTGVSPLLSASASPARTSSGIPTAKFRRRSSSAARMDKSPSLLQAKSPRMPDSRSPVLPSDQVEMHSRSPRPPHASDRIKHVSKSPSPKSPMINIEEEAYGSLRAARVAWRTDHQSTTESDTSFDEKIRAVDRSNQPQSRSPSGRPPSKPDYKGERDRFDPDTRRKMPSASMVEQSTSDHSEDDVVDVRKMSEDSHLRRKNELVNLVAGLKLDLGPQNDGRSPTVGHRNAKRNVSQEQSDYSSRQGTVGIAVGGSSETVAVRGSPHLTNQAELSGQRNHGSTPRLRQDGSPSGRLGSQRRLSSTPRPGDGDLTIDANQTGRLLKPGLEHINRDSLLMLNADRQREAFGIPLSMSALREDGEILSSAESNSSLRNQSLGSECEGESTDGLGLSHGAERLFHALGIGSDAQLGDQQQTKKQHTSWRSSMAEAEKYLSETKRPTPATMSASSSSSSIYEDDVPDRPWQRRERDLDRVQSTSGNSIKSSWKKTLSQSVYVSLLERHGETEMRRQEVIWELCETEQAFVKSLRIALKVFVNPLLGKNRSWVSGLPSNVSRLLDWLEDIFQLHAQISSALQHTRSSQYPMVFRIAETLRAFVSRLEIYQPYIVRLDEVVEEIEKITNNTNTDLGEFFRIQSSREECAGMTLSSFLWLPLTRLGRYLKHFNELWSLTPRSHVDHLPTFSLLHSATMVVRVMREVKLREEEYTFVKDLLSRVQGFPNVMQLVRRERRLIAHGALQRVHISDRAKDLLEGTSSTKASTMERAGNRRRDVRFEKPKRPALSDLRRKRANSLDSCLSETTSMSSMSSTASVSSLDGESAHYKIRDNTNSNAKVASQGGWLTTMQRANETRPEKTRTAPLYAFVFTDLAIFTAIIPQTSKDGTAQSTLELLNDIGICRILSIADHSGNLGYDHLVGVHVLPMDVEQLDNGVLSDASATSLFIHLPKARNSALPQLDIQQRWWTAFEQCYHFTLRSLSLPSHSGRYLAHGPAADQDENTRQTVMAILASGLPLPKSSSVQMNELERNAVEDSTLREREERGWWALRFQQMLYEMQRDELPPPTLQRPSFMSKHKTVSGRRRLKLVSGNK